MKKFYETPAVEFTGFNAEDVITTSATEISTYENADAAAAFAEGVTTKGIANATVSYSDTTYTW